jgi:hypothetical protein
MGILSTPLNPNGIPLSETFENSNTETFASSVPLSQNGV